MRISSPEMCDFHLCERLAILLAVMSALVAMFGLVGGLLGKVRRAERSRKFILEMALWGLFLTFTYDILSSVGFYLAYPVYPSVWQAIYLTFIPPLLSLSTHHSHLYKHVDLRNHRTLLNNRNKISFHSKTRGKRRHLS